jgi:hypothetical protein
MHIFTQSCVFLALASSLLVHAAPRPEELSLVARAPRPQYLPGLTRRDGSGSGNKNNDNEEVVEITETEKQTITIKGNEIKDETDLVIKIKEDNKTNKKKNKKKDKDRKNNYKNKNKDEDTVIIVVQQIVDIRNGNDNRNTRYQKHFVTAKNNGTSTQTVQVTDNSVMTIANSTVAAVVASDTNVAAIQTADLGAPFQLSNGTQLDPSGAPAPSWTLVEADPAATDN